MPSDWPYQLKRPRETLWKFEVEIHTRMRPSHAGSRDDIHHVERNAGDSDKVCYRCGRTGHRPDKCYFKERDCYSCHVRGHTSKVCRKKKQDSKNRVKIMEQVVEKADEDNCSEEDVYNIYPVTEKRVPSLIVDIHIASKNISMEIDNGCVSHRNG